MVGLTEGGWGGARVCRATLGAVLPPRVRTRQRGAARPRDVFPHQGGWACTFPGASLRPQARPARWGEAYLGARLS